LQIKVTSTQKQEEDAGLQILKGLFIWWSESDDVQRVNEICAVVVTDHKDNGEFDNDYLSMMTMQTA